jgi:hypothetical protein
VERLCYRCNAPVASGTPFCPQCNAPQIRVTAESEQRAHDADATAVAAGTGGDVYVSGPNAIRWSAGLARTAVAAIASVALLQLITVFSRSAALAFLALPLGGWFAVYLYSRRQPGPVTAGMGARLGAVTGFFVFLICFCVSAVGVLTDRQEIFDMVQKAMKDAAAANPTPQADALIQQISTPNGMMTILFLAAVMFLFVSLVLCAVGGAATAGLVNRQR